MLVKLSTFGVRGFRVLNHLDVVGLGSLNLFVGKNNTGKTTFLEALRIYFSPDPRLRIFSLLYSREEFSRSRKLPPHALNPSNLSPTVSFEALFSGRPTVDSGSEFCMGPLPNPSKDGLKVKLAWLQREETADDLPPTRYYVVEDFENNPEAVSGYVIESPGRVLLGPLDRFSRVTMRRRLIGDYEPDVAYLSSSGMTMREIGETWDTIALTDEEDEVVNALRLIAPDIEKIVLIQSPQESNQRMLMVKLSTFPYPVPFKSLGEGAVHFLSLILAMIQARGGVALLDEVGSGVHYSVHDLMWKLILQQSIRLNVQVFATTHSLDCVNGFQSATSGYSDLVANLFRFERDQQRINVIAFSKEEVAIASEEDIEIR